MSLKPKRFGVLFCTGLMCFQFTFFSEAGAQTTRQNLEEIRKRGFAYLLEGNWELALTTFINALTIEPRDTLSIYGNSLALFNLKKFPEAASNLDLAVEILSKSKENNQLLADSLVLSAIISAVQKENTLSITKLQRALSLAPNHFDANYSLGRAYFGNGEIDKAVNSFQRAVSIQPGNPQARFFLATSLERAGKTAQALAEYQKVLELSPNNADGNLGLGVLLIKTEGDRSEEGLKAVQKAVAQDPNLYEAQIVLGKTLIHLNRVADAIIHLQKAAELAPSNPEPHFHLAIAYRKLGRKAEAAAETEIVKAIHEKRRGAANQRSQEEK